MEVFILFYYFFPSVYLLIKSKIIVKHVYIFYIIVYFENSIISYSSSSLSQLSVRYKLTYYSSNSNDYYSFPKY